MSDTLSGPLGEIPVKAMAAMLTAVDTALQAEGISEEVIGRVRNRLVWGDPDGADAVIRMSPEDLRSAQTRFRISADASARLSSRD